MSVLFKVIIKELSTLALGTMMEHSLPLYFTFFGVYFNGLLRLELMIEFVYLLKKKDQEKMTYQDSTFWIIK